ncbi:MAG: DEAD/DEAH box helicase [Pseudomonadota bacterium]|nr:DEAD/DEAH box helicase [Pseudomonadota bacterium]
MEDTTNPARTISSPPTPEAAGSDAGAPPSPSGGRQGARRRPSRRRKKSPFAIEAVAETAPVADDPWDPRQFKVPAVPGKTRFQDFDLPTPLLHAISDLGFQYCTPIQGEILPSALSGKDASGRAQTGTGKTAAFLIAIITRLIGRPLTGERMLGAPRVLILAPTRELVLQISAEARLLAKYCGIRIVSVFGGMDYEKQRRQLAAEPADIVVATPGRLLDFQRRGDLVLKKVEVLVIDEADRMLDMGFIPDVRMIVHATPPKEKRQTLMFSATLTGTIIRLASSWTVDPVMVEIEPEQVAVDTVEQIVYIVTEERKFDLLHNLIVRQGLERVLVFCNRRDEVRRLAERLTRYGVNCSELSGDIPQKSRIRRLEDFKNGRIRVLVATDVAGRGIHIEGMDHVINFTLPHDPEDYVHRIGRTGRAGQSGTAVSFADEGDAFYIPPIEEFMGRSLPCIEPDEEMLLKPEALYPEKKARPRGVRRPDRGEPRPRPRRRPRF